MNARIYSLFSVLPTVTGLLHFDVRAELATIYFKEGNPQTVEFVGVERAQLFWKTSAAATDMQTTMRSEVDKVSFPTTESWRRAEEARESGHFEEALKFYQEVIADPVGHYYPFPGNFVSLAKERLLQVYRLRLDASMIAAQAQVVRDEFFHLPPEYCRVEPETAAWTAIANKSWEKAIAVLENQEVATAETFFLKGLALEALGKKAEAVSEYAGAYVLNFGGPILLTQRALQRSSGLLHELDEPDRKAELQAQLKLYRDLYGKGALWEGAPETLVSLADGEIKTIGEEGGGRKNQEQTEAPTAGAVVEDSATVVTLAPGVERDFLLPEELPERIYALGSGKETLPLKLEGGVRKEDKSFSFEGSGGFILVEPFKADDPTVKIRMQFEAENPDGILAHFQYAELGGFSLYLREGEILMDWAPQGAEIRTDVLGKISPDGLTGFRLLIKPDGARSTAINREGFEDEVPAGGLKIAQTGGVHIGDTGSGEGRGRTLSGAELPPFKGILHHFSIITGQSDASVSDLEIDYFGKKIQLLPPLPSEEAKER